MKFLITIFYFLFQLYKELTLPLFLMGKKLQAREQKLIQIIKDKDAEIAEYKIENVPIKRGKH